VRVDCHRFGWQDVGLLVAMVGAELRFPGECVYRPLNDHPLYQPPTRRSLTSAAARRPSIRRAFSLPECARAQAEVVSFDHRLLLGDDDEIGDVIRAFHKVWDHLRAPR
jgi:L-glutamine:scyllo-inosose aminotransferase/L-glutamine:2-deoxy-scyllo-inosose/3-amino-2,3-dideoxy-scyllo-inosose aminotransferase